MDTSLGGVMIIRKYLYEDDLTVNLLSFHGLRGEGVVFEVPNALEFCSKRNGSFVWLL
ncbi:hypothetical protein SLEP1_g34511 [Rubroshorea leprosula]|uniref:Uncharacterized protein n=1 Tax=Rubroshorea leprosula TaxID=152421 RepID=A0AAV5KK43_9ROSI|nr:hypothetical protein SLEP1_g34511 [Rubroshorea leprosula]